jgi:hypothetical protein
MKETIRLFREGKSREEIMEILGIAKSTVNVYLHNSGYSPKTNHRKPGSCQLQRLNYTAATREAQWDAMGDRESH